MGLIKGDDGRKEDTDGFEQAKEDEEGSSCYVICFCISASCQLLLLVFLMYLLAEEIYRFIELG